MNKWFMILLVVIFALFILFGVNAISYNSNSLTFRLNSSVVLNELFKL